MVSKQTKQAKKAEQNFDEIFYFITYVTLLFIPCYLCYCVILYYVIYFII